MAARILKGKDILDSYVFKDDDITKDGVPNSNMIVGYVLRTLTLPQINPYGIMKTTQALIKQAIVNKEKRKIVAPISETKDVELEKVPESELKRPKATGWVKEDAPEGIQSEDDKRAAFKARVEAKKAATAETEASNAKGIKVVEKKAPAPAIKTIKTTRKLPSIPSAGTQDAPKADVAVKEKASAERDLFCPFCGKDLDWKFCPYCGEKLPHTH